MEVGFHTLHHPVLTTLPDAELTRAVASGAAAELATRWGTVDLLEYPHGRTTVEWRDRLRARIRTAFRTGRRPVAPNDEPYVLWRGISAPFRSIVWRLRRARAQLSDRARDK